MIVAFINCEACGPIMNKVEVKTKVGFGIAWPLYFPLELVLDLFPSTQCLNRTHHLIEGTGSSGYV